MPRVWNSTLNRYAPLRSTAELKRGPGPKRKTPLRVVNPDRKRVLYARHFGDYAEVIRALGCLVCGRGPSDPHHVTSRGAGGTKRDLVPLDRRCHALLHAMGRESFEARFLIDLEAEAATLWNLYGDGEGE